MIRREELDFETEAMNSGHIAVPFQVTLMPDGTLDLLVYSFVEAVAAEFEATFAQNPFSDAAKAYLQEKLSPVMTEFGFDTDMACEQVHLEYRCEQPDMEKCQPDCELIDTLKGETWDELPLDEFELDPEESFDRMAVIRRNGKIVCFAGLNDISDEDGLLELTVECEEDYRMQGFGVSCIVRLTEYLMGLGEGVKYVCSDENIASAKTAESAGFTLMSKCMPFVCYGTGDEEE